MLIHSITLYGLYPDGMIPEDVTDPEDPKNKKTIAQKVDALYETPQSATKTPNEGGEAGISGTISVGLQGGISVKAFGENLSLFVNFGSIDVVTLGNEGVDMQKLPDTNIKEGVELGLGPVGVSKEIETSIDHSGIETKEKVSANLFNVEASSTSYKEVKNPESFNPQKTEVSNTSLGVTQSAKGGLFVVGSVSASASYTFGKGADNRLNPKYVASDATRVAPVVRRFKWMIMIVLINCIAFLIFAVFVLKVILHYKFLKSSSSYDLSQMPNTSGLVPKEKIRLYLLLFNASIMFPVFSRTGDRKSRNIINLLVFLFYLMIVSVFFLLAMKNS